MSDRQPQSTERSGTAACAAFDEQGLVLVLMGVSGSGKSTVAAILAGVLGWDLAEGDDMHPKANVAKMAAGHPLTDGDRWPWLEIVAQWIRAHTAGGDPGIITCSALKKSYRDVLRGENVLFVHLDGTHDQIAHRIASRHGHYMPPSLLDSQIGTLEPPSPDENSFTVAVDGTPAFIAQKIIDGLHLGSAFVESPVRPG